MRSGLRIFLLIDKNVLRKLSPQIGSTFGDTPVDLNVFLDVARTEIVRCVSMAHGSCGDD